MVVPSEKNSEILDLKMIESSEFKDCALNDSSSDHPKDPPSPDKTYERDKPSEPVGEIQKDHGLGTDTEPQI